MGHGQYLWYGPRMGHGQYWLITYMAPSHQKLKTVLFVLPVYSIVFSWFSSKGWHTCWHFQMQHNQAKFADIHFLQWLELELLPLIPQLPLSHHDHHYLSIYLSIYIYIFIRMIILCIYNICIMVYLYIINYKCALQKLQFLEQPFPMFVWLFCVFPHCCLFWSTPTNKTQTAPILPHRSHPNSMKAEKNISWKKSPHLSELKSLKSFHSFEGCFPPKLIIIYGAWRCLAG